MYNSDKDYQCMLDKLNLCNILLMRNEFSDRKTV